MTARQKCRLYFFLLEPSCTLWDQTCLFAPGNGVVWECFQSIFRMKMKEHCHSYRVFLHMAKVKPGIGNPHAQGPRPTLVLDLLTLTPPGSYPCFTKMIWNLPVQIRGDPSHMTIDYSATVDAALISSNFIGFSHKPWRKSFLKKRGDGGHWSSTTLIGPGQWESVKLTCLQSSWGA